VSAVAFCLAAATGAVGRHLAQQAWNRPGVPWGTLAVNTAGAFVLGLLGGDHVVLGAGFCGALTTFSGFAGEARRAGPRYVVLMLAAGGLAAAAGLALAG
jgi:CrcB protein